MGPGEPFDLSSAARVDPQENGPLSPEGPEAASLQGAEDCLERRGDIGQREAERRHPGPIDIHGKRRHLPRVGPRADKAGLSRHFRDDLVGQLT
jgi:hypothetical protein